jgi:hypothetical protein
MLSVLQFILPSYGCLVHFLAMASSNWGFKNIVNGVGLLCLCLTPILEDQDFISQFTLQEGLACALRDPPPLPFVVGYADMFCVAPLLWPAQLG